MSNWREKLKASAHGEVSRRELDPYESAGKSVYEYILQLDELRAQASAPNVQAALLAGWVAFSLQVLGDELLDADATLDPSTAHYLPRVTAEQAMAFYEPVPAWMGRARAAQASPSYRLDVQVPEVLPEWVEAEPCPHAHLLAFRQAVARLREHTDAVRSGFDPGPQHAHARDIVAQAVAEADAATDYANGLWSDAKEAPPASVHEAVESHLQHAVESYFYLGQVMAVPALADGPRRVRSEAGDNQPRSFLESMIRAYPQVAQRRRGGLLSGVGGSLLGGFLAGTIVDDILGGGGFGGGGFGGGFGGGGWGDGDGFT